MDTRIISRKDLFQSRLFNVEEVQIKLPNNKPHLYQMVNHHDSVTIVPVDEAGNIWFVSQFRVGAVQELLELPAGVIENGESPEICAAREVREEIGMAARQIQKLGAYYLAPGYCNEMNHAFIAKELYPAPLTTDEDEFLNISAIPIEVVYQMSLAGKIQDAKSLAALLLARPLLMN